MVVLGKQLQRTLDSQSYLMAPKNLQKRHGTIARTGGYSRMIPAAVLLCGEFMSVDSAEMDMAGTVPRHILSIKVGG